MDRINTIPHHADQAPRRIHLDTWSPSTHRVTQRHKTTRPDTIWPEEWPRLSEKRKTEGIANWDDDRTRLPAARGKGGFFEVSPEDADHFKVISEVRDRLKKRGSFNAVYSQRVVLGETCSYAHFPPHRET